MDTQIEPPHPHDWVGETQDRDRSHGLRVSLDSVMRVSNYPRGPDRSPFSHHATSPYHDESPALLHLWAASSRLVAAAHLLPCETKPKEEDMRDPWMEAACEQVTKVLNL